MKGIKFLVVGASLIWVAAISAIAYGIFTVWPYLEAILIKAAS